MSAGSRDFPSLDGKGPKRGRIRDRWKYSPASTRISNWRNRRAITRGKRDLPAKAADQVRSRAPVLRNRIDPSTGRPNRDARDMGRLSDQSLARTAPRRRADRDAAPLEPDARRTDAARDVAGRARIERLHDRGQREFDHLTARERRQRRAGRSSR